MSMNQEWRIKNGGINISKTVRCWQQTEIACLRLAGPVFGALGLLAVFAVLICGLLIKLLFSSIKIR